MRRGPASRSSADTTAALILTDSAMIGISASGERVKIAWRSRVMLANNEALDVMPYLITSYRPARNSRRGSVPSTSGSTTTPSG